jgi:hypothetical protein
MPGISGLEAARLIGKLDLSTRALIFTVHESARLESEVREAGTRLRFEISGHPRPRARHSDSSFWRHFFGSASEPSPGSGENPGCGLTFFSILT